MSAKVQKNRAAEQVLSAPADRMAEKNSLAHRLLINAAEINTTTIRL